MAIMIHKGLLGTKLGMTRVFQENGDAIACTLIEAGPCTVVQRKTKANNGYEAIQIGFGVRSEKRITKPMQGHLKKSGASRARFLREVRLSSAEGAPEVGAKLTCEQFAPGDYVDVIGTMKGRGKAGVVKRHGFSTFPETHGNHYFWRHGGSIGSRKPAHTLRGTRMSGQMGNCQRTVQSLKVLRVEAEKNLLYVQGAIPGPEQGLVLVRQAKKRAPKAAKA